MPTDSSSSIADVARQLQGPIDDGSRRCADLQARSPVRGEALAQALQELEHAYEELCVQNETIRKAAEALVLEHRRYVELIALLPDAYVATSSRGQIIECNPAAGTLFNVPAPRLVGRFIASFVALRARGPLRVTLAEVTRSRDLAPCAFVLEPHSGMPTICVATLGVTADADAAVRIRWFLRPATTAEIDAVANTDAHADDDAMTGAEAFTRLMASIQRALRSVETVLRGPPADRRTLADECARLVDRADAQMLTLSGPPPARALRLAALAAARTALASIVLLLLQMRARP